MSPLRLPKLKLPAFKLPKPSAGEAAERSVRLRVAVLVNSLFAFWAYGTIDSDMPLLLPAIGVTLGSLYSHWLGGRSNFWLKWGLAAGMLYVLYEALDNLVRGTIDPRLSLAQLLLWLQVLNSFDLPRRKNLRVALLVTSILMVVAGTMSRSMAYGGMLAGFALTLLWAMHEAYRSEVGLPDAPPQRALGLSAGMLAGVLVLGFPLFMLAPRQERSISSYTLPMSVRIPLPARLDTRVHNARMLTGQNGGAQSNRGVNGFSETLDLNIRALPNNEVVLRVKADRPQYWRAMAFDRYDGRAWKMSDPTGVDSYDGPPFRPPRPAGQLAGPSLLQTFYIEQDQANLIFAAGTARLVYFPTVVIWRDRYDSLRSPVPLQRDTYYSVVSETPVFDGKALAKAHARPIPERLKKYLQLPDTITPRTRQEARRITAGLDTPYQQMQAIKQELLTRYTYRLDVPEAPAGREWVDHFLFDQREGFCEQFATSLAVMGRLHGIPTRLVTGYVPGEYNPFSGFWEVKGKHAHAWVEAWIPTQGWLPFDATPAGSGLDTGVPDAPQVQNPAKTVLDYLFPWLAGQPWGAVAIAAALGSALAIVWRFWAIPRWAPRPKRPTALYRRLRGRAKRLGVAAAPADTPGAWLESVARVPRAAQALPELREFVARYEAVRFGGSDEAALTEAARQAEAALRRPAPKA
jgi:transglutaminase-like putative cysteine protease